MSELRINNDDFSITCTTTDRFTTDEFANQINKAIEELQRLKNLLNNPSNNVELKKK